jgi:hypothetical protein
MAGTLVDGFVVHELMPDMAIAVTGAMPALSPEIDATVERLWQAGIARVAAGGAGRLFNGRVFSADSITPGLITGHLTEFRRVVAQMEDPAMFEVLGIRPLAVCGVLCCKDGIAVGRRPSGAVYQGGMWQLPPAGSVDAGAVREGNRIDLRGQILAELNEELGLPASSVTSVKPICLVEHPGSHVSDLGISLECPLSGEAVLAAHRTSGNDEYSPLLVIGRRELDRFVSQAGDLLVPPARVFLGRLGLLSCPARSDGK